MTDRFAEVRANTRKVTARLAAIHRQPWRLARNRRLRREAKALLAEGDAILDEIAPLPAWVHLHLSQHRHGTSEPGWVQHDHMGGGVPHAHDPETGFQVELREPATPSGTGD